MKLLELQKSKEHKILMRNGFMYPKLNRYIEIYFYLQAKIKSGEKKTDAITWTAEQFGIKSDKTIYEIIKKIEQLNKELEW